MTRRADAARFARAAWAVLDLLDPADLDRVLSLFAGAEAAVAAMCTCAAGVQARLHGNVSPEQEELLLAATLSLGRGGAGVHRNLANAADRFEVLLRQPGTPPEVAIAVRGKDPAEFVLRLGETHHIDTVLAARRDEPPMLRMMVAAAVAVSRPDAGCGDEAAATVLDRGAELAAMCRDSGLSAPGASLTVRGNADFLLTISGYAHAIQEWRGLPGRGDAAAASCDGAQRCVSDVMGRLTCLEKDLHRAMTVPDTHPARRGTDEPDVVTFWSAAAVAIGGSEAGRVFDRLHRGLRDIRLTPARGTLPVAPGELAIHRTGTHRTGTYSAGHPAAQAGGHVEVLAVADALATRMVTSLLRETSVTERAIVADWVRGRRAPDVTDGLPLLLRRLRGLMRELRDPEAHPAGPAWPTQPFGLEALAMIGSLRDAIASHARRAPGNDSAVELAASVLPPLWTVRTPIIRALTQRIKMDEEWRGWNNHGKALVLAATAARGPGQVAVRASTAPHPVASCTSELTETGHPRCAMRTIGIAVDRTEVCPARPWHETGFIESFQTLGGLVDDLPDAIRKRVDRARNDAVVWPDLTELDQP